MEVRKRGAEDEPDEWFNRKFGRVAAIQRNNKKSPQVSNLQSMQYDGVKAMLESRLAVKRRDGLERRRCFYAADNEDFANLEEGEGIGSRDEDDDGEDEAEFEEDECEEGYEGIDEETCENAHNCDPEAEDGGDEKDELEGEEELQDGDCDAEEGEEFCGNHVSDEKEDEESNPDEQLDDHLSSGRSSKCSGHEPPEEHGQGDAISVDEGRISKKRIIIDDDEDDEEEEVDPHSLTDPTECREEDETVEQEGGETPREEERNLLEQEAIEEVDFDGNEAVGDKRKAFDYLDDEASLSGDDVGADDDDDDDGNDDELDEYEAEDGDQDELPDEEEIRENLIKQYTKHQRDEDDRHMMQVQEHFDELGQANTDRSFRFRMRDEGEIDWSKVLESVENFNGGMEATDDTDTTATDEPEATKNVELLKWRVEIEKKKKKKSSVVTNSTATAISADIAPICHLLDFGENASRQPGARTGTEQTLSPQQNSGAGPSRPKSLDHIKRRGSLLNASTLNSVVNDSRQLASSRPHVLFTSNK